MKEIEKLRSGEYYRMDDAQIAEIQGRAIALCQQIDNVPFTDSKARERLFRALFGSVGTNLSVKPGFKCDMGVNIHIGDNFLTNYDVTILDMAPVTIGDNVWIGGNATILMGVSVGDNAVIGAGAVVTHDVPDNAVAVGSPARVIRYIDNKQNNIKQ